MVCKKCNKVVEEGNKFCTYCGAPLEDEVPETNNNESVVDETPVATEQIVMKRKFGFVKGIIAAVVAVAAAVSVYAFTPVGDFLDSIFLSPEAQFRKIVSASLDKESDTIIKLLENAKTPINGVSGDIKLTISDELLDKIEDLGAGADLATYIGDVRSVSAGYDFAIDDKLFGGKVDFKLQDTDILSYDMVIDAENEMMYISIPEYIDGAAEIYMDTGMYSPMLSYNQLEKLTISDKFINETVDILKLSIKEIDEVEREKTTVSIDDVEQKCTLYTLKVDEKLLEDMLTVAIEEAKDNKNIKKEIVEFSDALEELTGEELSISENDIEDALEDALDEMELPEFDFDYCIYVDSGNNIIGRAIEVEDTEIKLLTAKAGSKYAFDYSVEEDGDVAVCFAGEGELVDDKFTGDVVLEAEEMEVLKVNAKDFYMDILESKSSGTITLSFGKSIIDEMPTEAQLIASKAEFEMVMNNTKESSKMDMNVKFGGLSLATLSMTANTNSNYDLKVPTNTYSEYEFSEKMSEIDPTIIIEKLEKAGIPTDVLAPLMLGGATAESDDEYYDDYYYDDYDYYDDYYYDDYYDDYDYEW